MTESGKGVLLLLDFVVNGISKNKGVDKALAKILYNRRHITADGGDDSNGVSIWLTTQAYNRIPLITAYHRRRRCRLPEVVFAGKYSH
jgi:hypothetical protein